MHVKISLHTEHLEKRNTECKPDYDHGIKLIIGHKTAVTDGPKKIHITTCIHISFVKSVAAIRSPAHRHNAINVKVLIIDKNRLLRDGGTAGGELREIG